MEALFGYLATPIGVELTHAVILLLVAAAAYLNYRAHQVAKETRAIAKRTELVQSIVNRSTPFPAEDTPNDPVTTQPEPGSVKGPSTTL